MVESELELESETEQSVQVLVESKPRVTCPDCQGNRVVGEPISIEATFQGLCKGWIGAFFYDDYICDERGFRLSARCFVGTCEAAPQRTFIGRGSTTVTPTAPGPIHIAVEMNDRTFVQERTSAWVPDRIEYECVAGPDERPCTEGFNPEPVRIEFALWSGPAKLRSTVPFTIETTAPGRLYSSVWRSDGPGHALRVHHGDLSLDLDIQVGRQLADAPAADVEDVRITPVADPAAPDAPIANVEDVLAGE